jgi:hypothetical protein
LEQPGNVEERLTFTYGQIPYAATGTNANGMELTPDRKNLIVVVSTCGNLSKTNISAKAIIEIALGSPVTSKDGLLLAGNIL